MSDRRKPAGLGAAMTAIRQIVGDAGCITDAGDIAPYVSDARDLYRTASPMLVRPAATEQVAAVVAACAEHDVAIVPQGGNTSLCGGSVPNATGAAIVLNLSRMNKVRALDPVNYTITVEAGCILAHVQSAAADADRLFPLSLAAEGSCEIGGNLSTNAGGNNVLRYGMARELVLGLEVVLADGTVWNGLRGLRKDNTGYDLKQFFLGAEGTLGVITAAVLKLFPKPRDVRTALVAVAGLDAALDLLVRAREASGDRISAFEYMERRCLDFVFAHVPGTRDPLAERHDHYVLIELASSAADDGLGDVLETLMADAIEAGLVVDGVVAASEAQSAGLWKIREEVSDSQRFEGGSIKHDISVPVSRMPEWTARALDIVEQAIPGARPVVFGHVGDGNMHFNVNQPEGADRAAFMAQREPLNRLIHDLACQFDGSFSAEHGIGQLKRGDLVRYKSAVEVDLMRRVKAALDPRGIMNPGKIT